METPYFSVVLPTKNRSFLIADAIQSLLGQTFPDWELIIADNDDTDATRKVVEQFTDRRIRYRRTGRLSMPDNWEAGCALAQGEYLTVIEDKQALKSYALEEIHRLTGRERVQSAKWLVDEFDEAEGPPRIHIATGNGRITPIPAEDLLREFTQNLKRQYKTCIPLGYRSCLHRKLVARIKSGPLGRLCMPAAPDFTMAYAQLAYSDTVWHIDKALALFTSSVHSNGRSFLENGAVFRQYVKEIGGNDVFFAFVPVKTLTVQGSIYNDYVNLQGLIGGRLAAFPINLVNYYIQVRENLERLKEQGRDMQDAFAEWERALGNEPAQTQSSVRLAVSSQRKRRGMIHRFGKLLGTRRLERAAKRFYRGKILRKPEWRFSNTRDYLRWDAEKHAGLNRDSK
jgi:glycosyltransferase involved in cell wall biosynthesis